MVLELERACYNEMERESMEYFYAAEKELQRQRERIRQLENILTENAFLFLKKVDLSSAGWLSWQSFCMCHRGCRFRAMRVSLVLRQGVAKTPAMQVGL